MAISKDGDHMQVYDSRGSELEMLASQLLLHLVFDIQALFILWENTSSFVKTIVSRGFRSMEVGRRRHPYISCV